MKDVCIVIPTHERPAYVRRCLAYYASFSCQIVICDSSQAAWREPLPSNVDYYHWPGLRFADKVARAAAMVGEAFVALAPDDDFLFQGAVAKGAHALRSNGALSACVGDVLAFPERPPFAIVARRAGGAAHSVSAHAQQNIVSYLENYHQILWSLFRRETLQLCFDSLRAAGFANENFFELSIATLCAGRGGICYIDDYWILREVTTREHWGSRHAPITSDNVSTMADDVARFTALCDSALFAGAAKLALAAYLSGSAADVRHAPLRTRIATVIGGAIARARDRLLHRVKWRTDRRFAAILTALDDGTK